MARRKPREIIVTLILVLAGVWFGMFVLIQQSKQRDLSGPLPDVEAHHLDPTALDILLKQHGYTGKNSWSKLAVSDISYRYRVTRDQESLHAFTCTVAPKGVADIIAFSPDLRRPLGDRPPEDWPRDGPFAAPAWWDCQATQSLYSERRVAGFSECFYVGYAPATQRFWFWSWKQRRASFLREALPIWHTDAIVEAIADQLIEHRQEVIADGWLLADQLDPLNPHLAPLPWPPGTTRAELLTSPKSGHHRYLLALHGIGPDLAAKILLDQPRHPLPPDAPPPLERWSFALPATETLRPPAWFAPGPGPRWHHSLVMPGTGSVHAGRWIAYDEAAKSLYIWDWTETSGRDDSADLASRGAVDGK